jgi:hypothetical protein
MSLSVKSAKTISESPFCSDRDHNRVLMCRNSPFRAVVLSDSSRRRLISKRRAHTKGNESGQDWTIDSSLQNVKHPYAVDGELHHPYAVDGELLTLGPGLVLGPEQGATLGHLLKLGAELGRELGAPLTLRVTLGT